MKKILIILILILFTNINCREEDAIGKIIIKYEGNWQAEILNNYNQSTITGTGDYETEYINPERLSITVLKQDNTYSKLVLYIYEDERIVASDSTREPQGTVSAEYKYPY